ncbi:MAG: hypothetical protein M1830_001194 [Pleopsidium flavum]|nr:MAG: hypothetical protein M1830_001194 [Pleopsidium flavum]
MAPVNGKRPPFRAPSAKSGSGSISRSRAASARVDDTEGITTTKKDRRTIKHSTFVSRIEKANSKVKKRRRPSKKLVANLESLANALPDGGGTTVIIDSGDPEIRHKSLKSRPGAMKQKGKVERMEKDRFGRNMAQMAGTTAAASIEGTKGTEATTAESVGISSTRWAALRGFIQQTLEQKPEFKIT